MPHDVMLKVPHFQFSTLGHFSGKYDITAYYVDVAMIKLVS